MSLAHDHQVLLPPHGDILRPAPCSPSPCPSPGLCSFCRGVSWEQRSRRPGARSPAAHRSTVPHGTTLHRHSILLHIATPYFYTPLHCAALGTLHHTNKHRCTVLHYTTTDTTTVPHCTTIPLHHTTTNSTTVLHYTTKQHNGGALYYYTPHHDVALYYKNYGATLNYCYNVPWCHTKLLHSTPWCRTILLQSYLIQIHKPHYGAAKHYYTPHHGATLC